MSTHKARKRIRTAKKDARPELKGHEGWHKKNYYYNFNLSHATVNDNVERIDAEAVSKEDFIERYNYKFFIFCI